jgi:hypothetical protein
MIGVAVIHVVLVPRKTIGFQNQVWVQLSCQLNTVAQQIADGQ